MAKENSELKTPNSQFILVVEDSEVQAETLRRMLVKREYKVSVAKNGAEGLEMTKKEKPSLIISDILMPVMDGYKMCSEIKKIEELKNIPVILLTQLSEAEDILNGLEVGAENYITKPFNEDYIILKIEFLLQHRVAFKNRPDLKGIEISYAGKEHLVRAGREQTINFLLSTYENTVYQNKELNRLNLEFLTLKQHLEEKIRERTAILTTEIEIRKKVEEELKTRVEELERFKKATIQRELKMKELKDKLKEMEKGK
ncbi:MAG: response regulator [Nitrospinae bacterium]|nr:response regulator [Nitrospinota bacterium]